ncbi:MAG: AMP-dependent synthetase and ligase [Conexibacter sp.]|nr:AMP-dependent synthetase and ligase [Conexibacter sp.]
MVQPDAWLPRAAAQRPDHPALVTGDGSITYAQLLRAALDAAAALAGAGIGAGDRVAVALPPGVPFVATLHACLLLGAAIVPIDLRLAPAERDSRAAGAALVVDRPLVRGDAPDAQVRERLDPDAVATVMHTSGTTAAPKQVELTVGNWAWNALGSAIALGLDPADRWLCTLPLSHVGGLSILLRSAIYGTSVVLHERFEPAAAARAINDEQITLVSLVGTTLQRVLEAGAHGRGALRCALIGGGPLAPALAARAAEAGIPVAQTYGMTEACSQVTTSVAGEPETAGLALLGQRVAVASDGEILVAGETVAPGAATVDGWLHTGDLGRLDDRGRLVVTGRKADTIVSGGENVAPAEVEAVLLAHPAVADAGVYGRPDEQWGEAVVATVVLHDGSHAEGEELREHAAAHLARFKVPKEVAFARELPRTPSGKLLRRALSGNGNGSGA